MLESGMPKNQMTFEALNVNNNYSFKDQVLGVPNFLQNENIIAFSHGPNHFN
jgi:hypothetical protein